ncbi:hypothetical protein LEP1GSC016_0965 [Leptospira borgpetersenii serovar Hardjo-bovis str. Sponselee]|uniref:Uncharacterized protein n=2 Tax=Leptospira borgpetersenii TaxID=174 RepID=M6BHH4_LEPBO|nr:hypothetical protein LEP1GSC016_0965 [Leptospira borgpetersenii serovar Hardjo-bovis str. Sponselee]EMO65039.1 hypothetical protein LEP1GSC133_3670 [Leptospira borgpetersenii serovar Pomona str. 200901868]
MASDPDKKMYFGLKKTSLFQFFSQARVYVTRFSENECKIYVIICIAKI